MVVINKKLSGLLGIILSIIILIYFESFVYKIISMLGINIFNFSSLVQLIINIIIKLFMCYIIYFIYKSLIVLLVSVVILSGIMYLFRYVVEFLGDIFNINIINQEYYNIFDKTLNFSLIVKIINDYIIVPFLYCTIIVLSVDKFCKRNDSFTLFSGLLAGIIYAFSLSGTLGYVIINSLSMFLLFSIIAFLYRKQNSIWFVISLYSFYLILNIIIVNYFGWL